MSQNIEKIKELNELVELFLKRKHVIILNPEEKDNKEQSELDDSIEYDKADWKITDELNAYVYKMANNNQLSIEDKILGIFKKVCTDYVYDDNLISYIQKIDEDSFSLPDWYGRDIDSEWEKKRSAHNRRVCFELSRYLAKALTELSEQTTNYDVCIHWNKELIHYFVGLISDDYTIIIDPDDFFEIKDLTRLKTDLTINGIKILKDKYGAFESALEKFNNGRSEFAYTKIQEDIAERDRSNEITEAESSKSKDNKTEEDEEISFFSKAMEILSEKYDLDSQGIYEYMKEIADIKFDGSQREKVWKKIEGETNESTRYIRCLILHIKDQNILLDVDEKIVRQFDENEFDLKRANFIPYTELTRGGFDYYDGK